MHWVTEAELKEAENRAAKSYDDRFKQALLSEDDVGTVLRCHLVVERTLVAFLKERFGNPDILDKELGQLSYANIVALAVLGKIRNQLGTGPVRRPQVAARRLAASRSSSGVMPRPCGATPDARSAIPALVGIRSHW